MFSKQNIQLRIGGEKLEGILHIPQSSQASNITFPATVIYHGRGSSKQRHMDRAEAFASAGFLTFIFDFRGCGESDGNFSEQIIANGYEDALAGYDFLANHELADKERTGIWGGSFGGYQGALVSHVRPVKSLVLGAPAIYKDEWWNQVVEQIDKGDEDLLYIYQGEIDIEKTKAMAAIRDFKGSLFIEEHENDEVIPQKVPKAYYDTATNVLQKEHKVMKDAPHALHDEHFRQESIEWAVDWLKRTL